VGNVEKAIADAGLDVLPRNIVRSTDAATTLDSKVRYQIDAIQSADSLEPIRTLNLTEEVDDVDKALSDLRKAMPADSYREVDYNVARDAAGRVTAHYVIDVPIAQMGTVQVAIGGLGAIEKNNQLMQNNNVPETRFARERVDMTLMSRGSIVKADEGLWRTTRAALSTASGALIYSLYLVLTGLLFVLPFVLIAWPVWVVMRRRRATT
jgi:hypothetical protein